MPMSPRLLRPRATGGFDPRAIPGCTGWFDASNASTLTLNGSNVSQWRNLGSAGGSYSQSTAANQPPTTTVGGKTAIAFSGTQSLGAGPTLAQLADIANSALYCFFVLQQPTAGNTVRFFGITGLFGGGTFGIYVRLSPGTSFWDAPESTARVSGSATALNSLAVGRFVRDGSAASIAFNSVAVASRANASGTIGSGVTVFGFENASNTNVTTLAEAVFYNRTLSFGERRAIESYLATKWGFTLPEIPAVSNPEAQDWVERVYQNGGTVSASTAAAVNTFCEAINAAGIRDRFFRLNLFCGNSDASLNAVRTPLYRGQSLAGAQLGNTLDTNGNFSQGDYAETGPSGGLVGNGANKSLFTGLAANNLAASNNHLSVYGTALTSPASNFTILIGSRLSGQISTFHQLQGRLSATAVNQFLSGSSSGVQGSPVVTEGMLLGTATSAADIRIFANGVQSGASTTVGGPLSAAEFRVFDGSNTNEPSAARLRMYSVGLGMTASQSLAFYNAAHTFQAALGRQA